MTDSDDDLNIEDNSSTQIDKNNDIFVEDNFEEEEEDRSSFVEEEEEEDRSSFVEDCDRSSDISYGIFIYL